MKTIVFRNHLKHGTFIIDGNIWSDAKFPFVVLIVNQKQKDSHCDTQRLRVHFDASCTPHASTREMPDETIHRVTTSLLRSFVLIRAR